MRSLSLAVFATALLAVPAAAQEGEDVTPPDYTLHLKSMYVDTEGDRKVKFALTCNETHERCIGTLRLQTHGGRRIRLGRRMFDVPPEARRRVTLRLTKRNATRLRALMERDRARLRAVAQSYDTFGNRARRALIFTALPPRSSA